MNDVFISYAREDENFVRQLDEALRSQGHQPWIDWGATPIPPERWLQIERAIEGTQTFVFVISPYSVHSTQCNHEIRHALLHHKRLVPIVYRSVSKSLVPEALQHRPFLKFRKQDLQQLIDALTLAIDTDFAYVREHTQLQKSAIEWEEKGRNPEYLLREASLQRSQDWLIEADQHQKEPRPSDLQRRYVFAGQGGSQAPQPAIAGKRAEAQLMGAPKETHTRIAELNQAIVAAETDPAPNQALIQKLHKATETLEIEQSESTQRSPRLVWIGSGALATTLIGSSVAGVWSWKTMTDANTAPEKTEAAKKPSAPSVAKAPVKSAKPKAKTTKSKTPPKAVAKPKVERVQMVEQSRPSLPPEPEVKSVPEPRIKSAPGLRQKQQQAIAAHQRRQAQMGVLRRVDPKLKLTQQQQQIERALLATREVWKQQTAAIVQKRQTAQPPEHENLREGKKSAKPPHEN
jgi:hypothetical protein